MKQFAPQLAAGAERMTNRAMLAMYGGLTSSEGMRVAEVSPEAAVGGSLALVRDGDEITIDADARTLDLHVDEDELARRREALGVPELPRARGYLSIYQRSAQPMSTGAVLVEND